MAYIDDLNAPRQRTRRPVIGGAAQPPMPDVSVTYGGQSPVDTTGNPNPGYGGNSGITPKPAAPPPPPVVPQGAGGGTAVPRPTTPPPTTPTAPAAPQGQNVNYAQALDALYKKYFYRAPTPGEAQTHIANLTRPHSGTLSDIERELQREAARLQLKPPTTAPADGRGEAPAGVDPTKWAAGHTSPKYAFMDVSRKYDQRTAEGRAQTLAELQRDYPQWFNNWTIAGDKLRYAGDMNALQGEWDGYNEFDAWGASGAGVWRPQWMPTQRNGQAYVDPGAAQGASSGAGATGGTGATGAGGATSAGGGAFPGLGGSGGMDFGVTGEYGYDDPNTRQLEEFLRMLIDEKVQPIDDPARTAYATQMWDAINQLTNPALTENDRARLENRALEPMERDRQIRLQQQKEQLAARGLGESSGIITEALAGIDRDFDRRRGEVQRDLSIYDREQQDGRRRESLSMGEALSNLSGQQRGEQDARMREALTYLSLFPEMDERRMRLAMETLGMSNSMANTPSIFNTLSNLQAQANASAQQGQQANAQFWGQMGQWMANAWPKDGGA